MDFLYRIGENLYETCNILDAALYGFEDSLSVVGRFFYPSVSKDVKILHNN